MPSVRLNISLSPLPGEDTEVFDGAVRRLRRNLLVTDVDAVDRVRADAPAPGSKGVAEILDGVLAIGFPLDAGIIQTIVETIVTFLQRDQGRTVTVRHGDHELTIEGASRRDVTMVVSEFYDLARRSIEP